MDADRIKLFSNQGKRNFYRNYEFEMITVYTDESVENVPNCSRSTILTELTDYQSPMQRVGSRHTY